MVQISEKTSDGGSNGGDPNKDPQEEANQNENAIQQLQNLKTKKKKKLQNLPNLPEELREIILARIPRDRYPKLSLASKPFGHIFTSPRLFETRSSLGRIECVLYAFIGFPSSSELRPSWYILHRINNSLRLSIIDSLPSMILGSAVVTIGHEIYIIGGNVKNKPVSTGFAIDCRFHTWRCLPNMRRARHHAAAGVIDGKIYVIGGCTKQDEDWIQVFDVKNQIWETVPSSNPNTATDVVMEENIHILDGFFGPNAVMETNIHILDGFVGPNAVMETNIHILDGFVGPNVVMEDKIYIWDGLYCFAYEPRRRRWESWGIGSSQRSIWPMSCCVVDDVLYSINPTCSLGYPIVAYDPRDVVWRPVKGVSKTDLLNLVYYESKMANFGGKLVILGRGQSLNSYGYYEETDIGCIVIALERRDNGEIWGKVESKSCVLTCKKLPFVEHTRTVTV